jgi:hypothetical protein
MPDIPHPQSDEWTAPGQTVQRDSTGWIMVVVGALIIIGAVFAGGTLFGPTDQATIASNVRPDGVRTGVGNTPAPAPPAESATN